MITNMFDRGYIRYSIGDISKTHIHASHIISKNSLRTKAKTCT